MNCHDLITNFLSGYLEGSLDADTRADFEHHLDVCPSCVAYLQTYRTTIAVTAAAGRVADDVPEELVQAILASVK